MAIGTLGNGDSCARGSEPTALAAGLEVGRFDLQTVWPMSKSQKKLK